MPDFRQSVMSLIQEIVVYNRRKPYNQSWLVKQGLDIVEIWGKKYDEDTGVISDYMMFSITREDILTARDTVNDVRAIINTFVTEVQAL